MVVVLKLKFHLNVVFIEYSLVQIIRPNTHHTITIVGNIPFYVMCKGVIVHVNVVVS